MTHLPETLICQLQESVAMELSAEMPPSLRSGMVAFLGVLVRRRGRLLKEEATNEWPQKFRENEDKIDLVQRLLQKERP